MIIVKKIITRLIRLSGVPFIILEAICTRKNVHVSLKHYTNIMDYVSSLGYRHED